MNGGAQYSKACEGATLPWVQIPPPPPLTCDDATLLCLLRGGGHRGGLSFGPQMVSVDRAEIPAAGCIGPELRPCTVADVIREETLVDPPSVQVEALVQADAPAKPDVGFLASGRAAEPMRTPPMRALCRSRARRDRPRPAEYPPTDRITLIERFWENAHRPVFCISGLR